MHRDMLWCSHKQCNVCENIYFTSFVRLLVSCQKCSACDESNRVLCCNFNDRGWGDIDLFVPVLFIRIEYF